MICRDDGVDWLLISQVEHARLAGEIAAVWAYDAEFAHAEWLVSAVCDHDEGWRSWELAPRIDPATGRPRDFMEMPMREATIIWTRSISHCGRFPFCSLWVSRHFCHLAESARESRRDSAEDLAAIERFLEQQNRVQQREVTFLTSRYSEDEFRRLAGEGLQFLQFFDRLSLWICCATRTEPEVFEVPQFGSIRVVPLSSWQLRVEPYPLTVERLELAVPAKRILANRLADDGALRSALSRAQTEDLRWTVTR